MDSDELTSGDDAAIQADRSPGRSPCARFKEWRMAMYGNLSLSELDDRIAIVRDNLRQLVEQAAATSGSRNEERIADRIAQQEEELSKLVRERDSRAKK